MNEPRGQATQRRHADRTYVLFLDARTEGEADSFRGRVEHVRTGASRRFESVEEFLAFVGETDVGAGA